MDKLNVKKVSINEYTGSVTVDVVTEPNDMHKKITYRGETFIITDVIVRNQHGVRSIMLEGLEESEYIRELNDENNNDQSINQNLGDR